ncbi:ComF family protein [Aquabacterium sp. A7-Y]|uniref:ComF family protein n=1 Tax=Aquabacterium sp. A7-Y TaxID=1349605 RepID=UPI00223D9E90|nr:ComF family protein [Aquabacterium sp. A7-Y]MCW7537422.1 ComF family protein [Aquabacterium sp. A7-Y]
MPLRLPLLAGLAAALPSLCAVCRAWQSRRVCADCVARYSRAAPRCGRCAAQVPAGVSRCGACLKHPPAFDHTVAALPHAYPWHRLVAALKFEAALDLVGPLGERLLCALQTDGAGPAPARPLPDLILPTPLSRQRLAQRGYNPSWQIARWLAARLQLPARADLLLRHRDTLPQLSLPPRRRVANVRGAFEASAAARPVLQGRQVALVDDVMTTGATAGEMARVLKAAGAAGVQLWVVTRTALEDGRRAPRARE